MDYIFCKFIFENLRFILDVINDILKWDYVIFVFFIFIFIICVIILINKSRCFYCGIIIIFELILGIICVIILLFFFLLCLFLFEINLLILIFKMYVKDWIL